jgi:MSHA biogenesis protein MshL
MKSRSNFLAALITLFLAGCASHQTNPGGTFDRISQELKDASATRSKSAEDALNQAMLPPLQVDLPVSAKSVEPRFDLAVSNAPANQVFMALVTGTRYSMLLAPDVSGTVTVNLKNVSVREALETLRELYGYEFKYQGTRIYIQSNAMQTRMFQINYLAGRRQGQSDVRVSSSSFGVADGRKRRKQWFCEHRKPYLDLFGQRFLARTGAGTSRHHRDAGRT